MPRNIPTFNSNNLRRPYDDYMSIPARNKARELRKNPTGDVHELKVVNRGGHDVTLYPWKKMELGDMFFAPIGDKSPKAMRVGFQQAAARHDFEICVIGTRYRTVSENLHEGATFLRVSVTAIGIARAKQLAFEDGAIPYAPLVGDRLDSRLDAIKKRRAAAAKQRYKVVGYKAKTVKVNNHVEKPKPNPFAEPKLKAQIVADEAYERHKQEQIAQGYNPDVELTREQKRAFAMRKAK